MRVILLHRGGQGNVRELTSFGEYPGNQPVRVLRHGGERVTHSKLWVLHQLQANVPVKGETVVAIGHQKGSNVLCFRVNSSLVHMHNNSLALKPDLHKSLRGHGQGTMPTQLLIYQIRLSPASTVR